MSFKWTSWIAGGLGAVVFFVTMALDLFHQGFSDWVDHATYQLMAVGTNPDKVVYGLLCGAGLLVGGAIGFAIDMARFVRAHQDPHEDPYSPWEKLD